VLGLKFQLLMGSCQRLSRVISTKGRAKSNVVNIASKIVNSYDLASLDHPMSKCGGWIVNGADQSEYARMIAELKDHRSC